MVTATPEPWRPERPRVECVNPQHYKDGRIGDVRAGGHVPPDTCTFRFVRWEEGYGEIYGKPEEMVAGTWDYETGGVQRAEDISAIVALRNAAPTLLALARAGRRLAEAAERLDRSAGGVGIGEGLVQEFRVALAAWREADGG